MVRINPPAEQLGMANAIVAGRARRYEVHNFSSPLSLKAVMSGRAVWSTATSRFEIGPSRCLVLNDGEEYSLEVDSLQPVETFCIFFARGYVEEAHRAIVTGSAELLDRDETISIEFAERLHHDGRLLSLMRRAHRSAGASLEESIITIARHLAALHTDSNARVARLPSLRATTREELRRRLLVAVDTIHGDLAGDLSLERIAREACLAPFHFHRVFTAYFGETPHRYVTRLRLEQAASLLAAGLPVIDVAFACGFESVGSFTTLFSRRFGAPPATFRKNREATA